MPHYLDNAATTPVEGRVLEAMLPYFTGTFGNASSVHGFGQAAKRALEAARREVALLVGAQPSEVIFTAGGTEADNTALLGLVRASGRKEGRVIVSAIEHKAVLHVADELEALGYGVTRLGAASSGAVEAASLRRAMTDDTILVSIMWANNETGVVQPVEDLARIAHERGALFHSDAVQAAGHVPIDMRAAGVDALSLSGHKLSGPKGIGALVVHQGVRIQPLLVGGAHERGRRAGTENVAGAVGFGEAARLWRIEGQERQARLREMGDALWRGLSAIPGAHRNGDPALGMGHIVNVRFDGCDGEAILLNLDLEGIAASSGSACSAGSIEATHVLLAMGFTREEAMGAVRFSLGIANTMEDVEAAVDAARRAVERVRRMGPSLVGRGL